MSLVFFGIFLAVIAFAWIKYKQFKEAKWKALQALNDKAYKILVMLDGSRSEFYDFRDLLENLLGKEVIWAVEFNEYTDNTRDVWVGLQSPSSLKELDSDFLEMSSKLGKELRIVDFKTETYQCYESGKHGNGSFSCEPLNPHQAQELVEVARQNLGLKLTFWKCIHSRMSESWLRSCDRGQNGLCLNQAFANGRCTKCGALDIP